MQVRIGCANVRDAAKSFPRAEQLCVQGKSHPAAAERRSIVQDGQRKRLHCRPLS